MYIIIHTKISIIYTMTSNVYIIFYIHFGDIGERFVNTGELEIKKINPEMDNNLVSGNFCIRMCFDNWEGAAHYNNNYLVLI